MKLLVKKVDKAVEEAQREIKEKQDRAGHTVLIPSKYYVASCWIADVWNQGLGSIFNPFVVEDEEGVMEIQCFSNEKEKLLEFYKDAYELTLKHANKIK